jgi:hypothetical protein
MKRRDFLIKSLGLAGAVSAPLDSFAKICPPYNLRKVGDPKNSASNCGAPTTGFQPPYALPARGSAVGIGTNNAMDVCPTAEGWANSAWDYSLFNSYGGGVFVPQYSTAGAYVAAGTGGHGHPDNHGAAVFDFQNATWVRLDNANGVPRKSVPPHSYNETTESNGSPYYEVSGSVVPLPPHPYANMCPSNLGAKGSIAYITRAALGGGAANTGACHRFDIATRTWSRMGTSVTNRAQVESDSIYDAARNRYWFVPLQPHYYQNVAYFDAADFTWKTSGNAPEFYPSAIAGYYRVMLHNGMLIRNCGGNGLWLFDPDQAAAGWIKLNVSGSLPNTSNRWAKFSDGKFYSIPTSGGNTLTRITPPADPKTGTWIINDVTIGGATLPPKIGSPAHYSMFFYVPAIDCLAWIAGGTNKVFIMKPA